MSLFRLISVIAAASITLTGCNNVTREMREFRDLFNPPVNVTDYNYAVVDGLVNNAAQTVRLDTPIGLGILYPVNLHPSEAVPPFGKVTIDQMATRLIQLGYNVHDLGDGVSEAVRTTPAGWMEKARAANVPLVLTGNYTITEYDILVNARLVNVADGRLLSSSDYRVPLGSDTYRLLGRDPFYGVREKPRDNPHNPDAKQPGKPMPIGVIPSRGLPVKIVP